jgi:serine/threonine protein kinase
MTTVGYPFEVLQEIGRGGLGIVYLAYHHRLQKHVVLKKVSTARLKLDKLRIEVDLLKNLHHNYLPQVYDFVQVGNDVFTVMEYIEGVSLAQYLKEGVRLPQEQLIKWLRQLGEVLAYLHSYDPPIIHSDIKPDNVMITPRGDVCLIDFNISQGEVSKDMLGLSCCYASPEQLAVAGQKEAQRKGRDAHGSHGSYGSQGASASASSSSTQRLTPQSDIYSLGATFYWLILAIQPAQVVCPLPALEDYDLAYDTAFLRVIDRAVAVQGKRFPSAVKLLEALDNLQRFDVQYQKNRRLQWMFGTASVALFLVGFLLSLYGWTSLRYTAFQEAYDDFKHVVSSGTYDAIISRGYQVLNDPSYAAVLSKKPADKAAILHAMGDCYFQKGEYNNALFLYEEALDWGADSTDAVIFYRDYAIVLVRMASYEEALSLLDQAAFQGFEHSQLTLVRAEIAFAKKDNQDALGLIDTITLTSVDAELLQRAHTLASQIYGAQGDWEQSIESLKKADTALSSAITLRRLADSYAQYAAVVGSKSQKESLLKEAKSFYETLSLLSSASFDDRLNLAIVNRSLGDYSKSERLFKELLVENSGDYRIAMNLAFLYELTGDKVNARSYCARALREYENTSEQNREPRNSTNIQALDALQRRLD